MPVTFDLNVYGNVWLSLVQYRVHHLSRRKKIHINQFFTEGVLDIVVNPRDKIAGIILQYSLSLRGIII